MNCSEKKSESATKYCVNFADWSLWDELTADETHSRINETQIAQPAIFSVQAALSALWKNMGIYPSAIVGHSVGEIAAAHIAGVLSLEDALRVTFHRSRLQQRTAGQGKMLAVGLPISEAEKLLKDHSSLVSVGAVNGPDSVTLSGDTVRLEAIAELLAKKDVFHRFLRVEVPYHSPLMEPLKRELAESLKGITPHPAAVPLYSTVTGKQIQGESLTPQYWAENMRNPVLFANAVDEIIKAGYTTFLEISAHPVLGGSVSECLEKAKVQGAVLHSLRRKEDEQIEMLSSVAKLYTIGYPVKWEQFYPNGNFIRVPTYSWQEERYWTESEQGREDRLGKGVLKFYFSKADAVHPLLGSRMASPHPIWNSELSPQSLDYIRDHQIQGSVVYPGAGYAEMALAAAKEIFGNAVCTLDEVRYKKAFFLPDSGKIPELQFIFDSDTRRFEVFSKTDENRWSLHITGKITSAPQITREAILGLEAVRNRCKDEISVKECYDKFHKMGFEYGSKFQGIKRFWKGNNEAFAQIYLPESQKDEGYFLHPVILDSCFQTFLGAAAYEGAKQTTYLPAKTERFGYYARPDINKNLWCYASLTTHNEAHLVGDIALFDDSGNLITEIRGFLCQSLETMIPAVDKKSEWLYEFQWENQELKIEDSLRGLKKTAGFFKNQGVWLIFEDSSDLRGFQLKETFLKSMIRQRFLYRPEMNTGS